MVYDRSPGLWFAPGCVTSQFNLATNEALLGVRGHFKLLLEEGNGHPGKAGAGAALAGVGNAGTVVVAKELLHLVPGHLQPSFSEPDPRFGSHMLLLEHSCLLLHLVVALDVHREGMGDAALDCGGTTLDDVGVLGLGEEDRQGKGGGVAIRQ